MKSPTSLSPWNSWSSFSDLRSRSDENIFFRICKYVQRRRWKVVGWRKLLLKTDIYEINYNPFKKTSELLKNRWVFYFVSRDSITVKHLTLGLVKLVTLNLINKIQDYGRAICSTSFTVTRKWTVTPISFYEIIEFYQNQVLTLANSYVICWYQVETRWKIMMIISTNQQSNRLNFDH